MCLITNNKIGKILEEDLKVFKLLKIGYDANTAHAPFYHFKYEFGKLYETEFTELDPYVNDHLWRAFDEASSFWLGRNYPNWEIKGSNNRLELLCISQGFHGALTYERCLNHRYRIYDCIIPKGSTMYTDDTGLFVSNKLIVVGLNNTNINQDKIQTI